MTQREAGDGISCRKCSPLPRKEPGRGFWYQTTQDSLSAQPKEAVSGCAGPWVLSLGEPMGFSRGCSSRGCPCGVSSVFPGHPEDSHGCEYIRGNSSSPRPKTQPIACESLTPPRGDGRAEADRHTKEEPLPFGFVPRPAMGLGPCADVVLEDAVPQENAW